MKNSRFCAKYHTIRIPDPNTVISAHPSGCFYKLFPLFYSCVPFLNANRDVLFCYFAFVKNHNITQDFTLYFTYKTTLVPRTVFRATTDDLIHAHPPLLPRHSFVADDIFRVIIMWFLLIKRSNFIILYFYKFCYFYRIQNIDIKP